jgi:hypothetical protein
MNASHDEFTLITSEIGPDFLNQTVTVVPAHESREIECDFVELSAMVTSVGMRASICAVI